MDETKHDNGLKIRSCESGANSCKIYRINFVASDEIPSTTFPVSGEVAARVRELLRRQAADENCNDVCTMEIQTCSFDWKSLKMLDLLNYWTSPFVDHTNWKVTEERRESYTVEKFVAAEHYKELSLLNSTQKCATTARMIPAFVLFLFLAFSIYFWE